MKRRRDKVASEMSMAGRYSVRWCGSKGMCEMGSALDRVVELLAKRADDAPIGIVVVEMRRFVRLIGEGVLRVRRRASCGGEGRGNLVGSLASYRLLQSALGLVVLQLLASCLMMLSVYSAVGGYGDGKFKGFVACVCTWIAHCPCMK